MTYTDLIFDLYGTLVDIHTEESDAVWEKTAMYFGFYGACCTGASLHTAFNEAMRQREVQAGQSYECFPDIPFEQVMTDLFHTFGVNENACQLGINAAQLFRIASIEYIRLYPGVTEALAFLRDRGFRLWLLSNAQQVFTAHELRLLGMERLFDGIYLSSRYGCRKPDVRFFQAVLEEQQLDPARCLMIGNDRDTDIAGAHRAGLATLYLHTDLTPSGQAAARPEMHPERSVDPRLMEFEGADWPRLAQLISAL